LTVVRGSRFVVRVNVMSDGSRPREPRFANREPLPPRFANREPQFHFDVHVIVLLSRSHEVALV
jgi:hypothetical protein